MPGGDSIGASGAGGAGGAGGAAGCGAGWTPPAAATRGMRASQALSSLP